jgi:hypothetical protein
MSEFSRKADLEGGEAPTFGLEQDDFSLNHHPALAFERFVGPAEKVTAGIAVAKRRHGGDCGARS